MSAPDDRRAALAARQAALVAALVTGGEVPEGVDAHRVDVAARALLRKRTGEVARHWPALLAADDQRVEFGRWAQDRARTTSWLDGWDFAEHLERRGALPAAAAAELADVRRHWTRLPDGSVARRRRMWAFPRAAARRAR